MLKLRLSILLLPLSILYGCIQKLRRKLYQSGFFPSEKLPGTTISVGNLEVGGTGKSPVSIAIANELISRGAKPVIVTRGYRSGLQSDEFAVLLDRKTILEPKSRKEFFADEARMQSAALPSVPIIIGSNRLNSCQEYLKNFSAPSHWILDDGFQHLRIKRDLDIVLMDANRPLDNGLVLPSGRLREFKGTLNYADVILLTRSSDTNTPEKLNTFASKIIHCPFSNGSPVFRHSPNGSTIQPDSTSKISLVCGIAKPQQLISSVIKMGLKIQSELLIGDHKPFDRDAIIKSSKDCDVILTTDKDYFRDPSVFESLPTPVATIPLQADIADLVKSL